MINSILNRHKDSVKFDNIIMDNNIITNTHDIKTHIQQHFNQWTGPRDIDEVIFNSTWYNEYEPQNHISSDWYQSALLEFSIEEVSSTLAQLPNNKACGPSGISYEMLKHAGLPFLQAITSLFNRCITSNKIPKQWKEGRIFPISKKPIFDGNLTNTRPISLLEHTKKLYTKLLTNRLNYIFTKYPILSPYNYIALPGNSTSIPIHILNNIIEDATCNSKDLWLISQDISKAYDSVNPNLFQKSLLRLNMPLQLIDVLTNLLTNRHNRVISNLGLTDTYQVQNGIDQGETITPLFWRIYYDPLIHRIASRFPGYTLSTKWQTDLHSHTNYHLQTSISVLAYMDDTLWISHSKEEMEHITSTAKSFYQMANLQVNPNKSVFATNSKPTTISFINSTLKSIPTNEPFKYLGCWFTLNNKQSEQIKRIQQETYQLTYIANSKKITDKQITYIINTVIIPTLEYRLHNIVLSRTICNNILAKYLTVAKHKSHLSRSIPNSTMLNPHLYNIRNIWDIQLQHHISNFLTRINNPNTLGITTRIRLQQLQNNLWSSTNILQHPDPIIDGPNRLSLNYKIIQLFVHLHIYITANSNFSWPHTIQYNLQPLETILNNHPKYNTFKQQLRKHKILYLEQLCSADNTNLLEWTHLSPRLRHIPKGKLPLWFSTLEDIVLADKYNRLLLDQYQPTGTNIFAISSYSIPKRSKPWIITINDNEIIFGKIRKQYPNTTEVSITHWQADFDLNNTSCYPLPPISYKPCSGCHLNSNRIKSACTLEISTTTATKFFGRIIHGKLKFNANYMDLIFSMAIKQPLSDLILSPPTIPVADSIATSIFHPGELTTKLVQISTNNLNSRSFNFYTDGSVINIGSEHCTMGIGWVQVDNNNQISSKFNAQIKLWPSSYKAELVSILSAIATTPRNSTINIYTDSQSIISKYDELISPTFNPNKLFKFNAWPLWHTFLNIMKSYQLQVIFHKVQAHTDNTFNNLADSLAKQHIISPYLNFNYTNIHNPYHILQWEEEKFFIEQATRPFIKNICKAHILAMWSSQQRNQEWSQVNHKIDWRSTWLYFNHNHKPTHNITNFKLNQLKSFKIKTLLNELPTHSLYHNLYPTTFQHTICFHCGALDSPLHWLNCSSSTLLQYIINTCINQYLNSTEVDLIPDQKTELIQLIQQHEAFNLVAVHQSSHYLELTLKGLIPNSLIRTVQNFHIPYKQASHIIIELLLKINEQVYEQLWKPYCTNFSNWRKHYQITYPYSKPRDIPSTNNRTSHPRIKYTYSCLCGTADQLHSYSGNCPPMGQAHKKISIWYIYWIKYSITLNFIPSIRI